MRAFSISCILASTLSSDSLTGLTSSSMACCRFSRSPLAVSWNFSEGVLRQFQERLVAALQGIGGQGLEGVGQFPLGVVEHGQFFLGLLPLLVERGGDLHELGSEVCFGGLCFRQTRSPCCTRTLSSSMVCCRAARRSVRATRSASFSARPLSRACSILRGHQPHRPAADGQADEQHQDGQK